MKTLISRKYCIENKILKFPHYAEISIFEDCLYLATCTLPFRIIWEIQNWIFNLFPKEKSSLLDCRWRPGNSLLGFRDDPGFDENSVAPRRVGDVDDFAAAVHLSSVVYGLGEFRVKASILLYNILVLSALSTFFYSTKFLSTDDSVRVRQKAAWRRRYRQHHCCNVPPS